MPRLLEPNQKSGSPNPTKLSANVSQPGKKGTLPCYKRGSKVYYKTQEVASNNRVQTRRKFPKSSGSSEVTLHASKSVNPLQR